MAPVKAPLIWRRARSPRGSRQAAAVQGDEAPILTRALGVDGARHQFLARFALAHDEHVALGARQVLEQLEDLLHAWALADEVLVRVPPIQLLAAAPRSRAAAGSPRRPAGQMEQSVGRQRSSGDVAQGAALHSLDRAVYGLVGGDEMTSGGIGQAANGFQQGQPGRVGKRRGREDPSPPAPLQGRRAAWPPSAIRTANPSARQGLAMRSRESRSLSTTRARRSWVIIGLHSSLRRAGKTRSPSRAAVQRRRMSAGAPKNAERGSTRRSPLRPPPSSDRPHVRGISKDRGRPKVGIGLDPPDDLERAQVLGLRSTITSAGRRSRTVANTSCDVRSRASGTSRRRASPEAWPKEQIVHDGHHAATTSPCDPTPTSQDLGHLRSPQPVGGVEPGAQERRQ